MPESSKRSEEKVSWNWNEATSDVLIYHKVLSICGPLTRLTTQNKRRWRPSCENFFHAVSFSLLLESVTQLPFLNSTTNSLTDDDDSGGILILNHPPLPPSSLHPDSPRRPQKWSTFLALATENRALKMAENLTTLSPSLQTEATSDNLPLDKRR